MEKIIDIHSHMFNLKYLPVAGILRRYTNKKIPHVIAKGLEWLLLKNTAESYPLTSSKIISIYKAPEYNITVFQFLNNEKFNYKIDDISNFEHDEIVTAIEQFVIIGDLISGELSDALDEFEKIDGYFNKVNFYDDEERIKYRASLLKRMLNWIINIEEAIDNYLKWFLFMTNSEEAIYSYITKRDETNVSLFLHLMMDVDHFLNDDPEDLIYKSRFDFEKVQINNMQKLNQNHNNLFGFVAFNPARSNTLEIIKKAINEKGFKGVKFYPPLGYQADDDNNYSNEIEELLSYCEEENIPLFTHCNNEGFEAWPKIHSGYHSNPKYWEAALIKHPKLILCLGHAGGGHGWFSENKDTDKLVADTIYAKDIVDKSEFQKEDWNKSYASLVFKLCVKYDNVFCDVSYLDEMINSDGSFDIETKENFTKRLKKLFESQQKFATRIMYGSDWHMLFQEGKNNVYLKMYLDFFNQKELKQYSEAIFHKNACEYLRLNSP